MKCPICECELRMSERHGVEIDYCPTCRGIWLDRGELDKLLQQAEHRQKSIGRHDDDDSWQSDERRGPPFSASPKQADQTPKKRESFWSELFDFG